MSGGRTGRAAAGLVALVGGLVLIVAGPGGGGGGLRLSGSTVVNADRPGLNAHNSPAAASAPGDADLRTVVVADRIDSPTFSCSLHRSTDGGTTWNPLAVPRPAGMPNCFWPDVAYDDQGALVVLATATGGRYNQPVGAWAQRYTAAGAADGSPVPVAPSEAFHAHLAAAGRDLVAAWVQAQPANADQPLGLLPPPNPIVVARSTDGGLTWSQPVAVSEPGRRVVHPVVVAGAGGEVLVGALDLGDDRLNYEALHQGQGGPPPDGRWGVVVWRSADGGRTWGPAVTVAADLVIPERVVVDLMGGPGFARQPGGGPLYAVWDGGRGDDRDVYVSRSADGGATWSTPNRLRRPGEQLLPAVSVAPDGRVDLVFYDRHAGTVGSTVEAVVGSSSDEGATFDTVVVSARPFDAAIGLASAQGLPQRGNQLAVLSGRDRILAFWADASGGTVDDNIQDLVVSTVELGASGRRTRAAAAGAFLALVGVVLVVTAVAGGRRRGRQPG